MFKICCNGTQTKVYSLVFKHEFFHLVEERALLMCDLTSLVAPVLITSTSSSSCSTRASSTLVPVVVLSPGLSMVGRGGVDEGHESRAQGDPLTWPPALALPLPALVAWSPLGAFLAVSWGCGGAGEVGLGLLFGRLLFSLLADLEDRLRVEEPGVALSK